MKTYNGVRLATEREIQAYEKVEKRLTDEEIAIIYDELYSDEKAFDELLENDKVINKKVKEIIKAHKITQRELKDWYFTEVD